MKIAIREGSAAKNFEALHELISEYPGMVMLCSDDKHPDDLLVGQINTLAARAVAKGHRWQDVLRAACLNPVEHYGLDVGVLRKGDPADMIVVRDLISFEVIATYLNGVAVFGNGAAQMPSVPVKVLNQFSDVHVSEQDMQISVSSEEHQVRVIRAIDGSLMTEELHRKVPVINGCSQPDIEQDILKIVVINRYFKAPPAVALIHGFGLKQGAIASSVAHDSHNIVAVGSDDASLAKAINAVAEYKGGIAAVDSHGRTAGLALPVAGIMEPTGRRRSSQTVYGDRRVCTTGVEERIESAVYDIIVYGIAGDSPVKTQR